MIANIAAHNVEAPFKLTGSMGEVGKRVFFCLDMLESGGLLSTKDLNQALQIFLLPRPAFKLWSSQHSFPALTILFMPSDAHKNVTGWLNNHEALFPSWIKPSPGFSILNLNASLRSSLIPRDFYFISSSAAAFYRHIYIFYFGCVSSDNSTQMITWHHVSQL